MAITISEEKSSKQILYDNINNTSIYTNVITYYAQALKGYGYHNSDVFQKYLFYNYKTNEIVLSGVLFETFYIDSFNLNMYLKNKNLNKIYNNNKDDLINDDSFAEFIKEKVSVKIKKQVASLKEKEFYGFELLSGYKAQDELTDDDYMIIIEKKVMTHNNNFKLTKNFREEILDIDIITNDMGIYVDQYINYIKTKSVNDLTSGELKLKIIFSDFDEILNIIDQSLSKYYDDQSHNSYGRQYLNTFNIEDKEYDESEIKLIHNKLKSFIDKDSKLIQPIITSSYNKLFDSIETLLPKNPIIKYSKFIDLPENIMNSIYKYISIDFDSILGKSGYRNNNEGVIKINLTDYRNICKLITLGTNVYIEQDLLEFTKQFIKMYKFIDPDNFNSYLFDLSGLDKLKVLPKENSFNFL